MSRSVAVTVVADARPVADDALCLIRLPVRRNLRDEIDTIVLGRSGLAVLGDEHGANALLTETPLSTRNGIYCIESDDYDSNYTAVWDSYLDCVLVAAGGTSDQLRVGPSGAVAPLLQAATFLQQQRLQQPSGSAEASGAAAADGTAADGPGCDEAVSFTCVATSGSGSVWVVVNGSGLFHVDVTQCRGYATACDDSRIDDSTCGTSGSAAAAAPPPPACQRLCTFSEPVTALAYDRQHRCLLVATGTELYAVPASGRPQQQPCPPWDWDGEPKLLLGGVGARRGGGWARSATAARRSPRWRGWWGWRRAAGAASGWC